MVDGVMGFWRRASRGGALVGRLKSEEGKQPSNGCD